MLDPFHIARVEMGIDLKTAGAIVGVVGGLAGILSLVVQWSVQLNARRANLRRHAAAVILRRADGLALLRNSGAERLLDVILEASVDRSRLVAPFGLTLEDFEMIITPARIPLGDVPPTSPTQPDLEIRLVDRGLFGDVQRLEASGQAGGPWSLASVKWTARPEPYLPAGLTDEKLADFARDAERGGRKSIYEDKLSDTPKYRVFVDEQERRRYCYEWLSKEASESKSKHEEMAGLLIELSVVFTDIAGRRWRRYESGTIELLGPFGRLSRALRLPRSYQTPLTL
jgi:hypothetical protein